MEIQIVEGVAITSGAEPSLFGDLYLPQSPDASLRAAVVLVFGGSWSTGDRTQQKAYGIKLAKAGFVCLAADYRLSSEAIWPAQLEDVRTALDWLRAQAATYQIDPQRIGISGNSSGGHLALMAALSGAPVSAVCAFYPPTDLVDLYDKGGSDSIDALLGNAASPETMAAISPLSHAHKPSPPVLLLSGDADQRVPVAHTLRIYDKLKAHGTKAELHIFSGQPHGFDANREYAILCSSLMIQFFNTHLAA